MSSITRWLWVGLVGLQLFSIVAFGVYQEFVLRTGTQITLQTTPIDPRDLFRGEYVVLRYEISTLTVAAHGSAASGEYCCISETARTGDTVLVGLMQHSNEQTASITYSEDASQEFDAAAGTHYVHLMDTPGLNFADGRSEKRVIIRGTIEGIETLAFTTEYSIEYGIESFFVPEGRGSKIEAAEDVKVVVVIGKNGDSVVKDLIVDGEAWNYR